MSQMLPATGVAILGIIALILILLLLGALFLWIRKRGQSNNTIAASHVRGGDDTEYTDVDGQNGSDDQKTPDQGMSSGVVDQDQGESSGRGEPGSERDNPGQNL